MNNMETIIIVSVLSTLGAVALLISIVVAFIKLKNKVDVNNLERLLEDTHQRISENSKYVDDRFDRLVNQLYETINNNDNLYNREFDDIRRAIDSRCDRLDSKIKSLDRDLTPKSDKQILKD
jgi:hypothetical protein